LQIHLWQYPVGDPPDAHRLASAEYRPVRSEEWQFLTGEWARPEIANPAHVI